MELLSFENVLNTVKGQFFPEQFSAQLFMNLEDLSDNYLIYFHERFHYLQNIFTPYGHVKWGCYRTYTAEIVNIWLHNFNANKKIPAANYLDTDNFEYLKPLSEIFLQNMALQFSTITESNNISEELLKGNKINKDDLTPIIQTQQGDYSLNGMDIIESHAKFEEALLAYFIENKPLNDTINPERLPSRYYIALQYFMENLSADRILEFPIVCELSLATSHLPLLNDINSLKKNLPSWRFVKIIDYLKENPDVRFKEISDDNFWNFTSKILNNCDFESWDELWRPAEEYAKNTDLTMAIEMLEAIKFKKTNPLALSFPFLFLTNEGFNRFHPLFTITGDSIFYNIDHISGSEMIFENHFQALSNQICGEISRRCIYPDMLQCGYSYFGLNECQYQKSGLCDGHINQNSTLPNLKVDDYGNIIEGCDFEAFLNIIGTSFKNITIGNIDKKISMNDLSNAIKKLKNS